MFLEQFEKETFDFLPYRSTVPSGNGKFKSQSMLSNIYPINMKSINLEGSIYPYYIKSTPEIPSDSKHLLKAVIRGMPSQIRKRMGYICSAGTTLWGANEVTKIESYEFQVDEREEKYMIDVIMSGK